MSANPTRTTPHRRCAVKECEAFWKLADEALKTRLTSNSKHNARFTRPMEA